MAYFLELIVPPSTTRAAPVSADIDFQPMIVHGVEIIHPTGCASLVGVWIEHHGARLWPVNTDQYFRGNGSPIRFSPERELSENPLTLIVKAYNDDTLYTHRPLILLDVEFVGTPAHEARGPLARLAAALGGALPGRA